MSMGHVAFNLSAPVKHPVSGVASLQNDWMLSHAGMVTSRCDTWLVNDRKRICATFSARSALDELQNE